MLDVLTAGRVPVQRFRVAHARHAATQSTLPLFLAPLAGYLAFGLYLTFGAGMTIGDSLSRVGNAYYTLYSRDPHLSAIGFVWGPLPSLVLIPFLPLKLLWPALTQRGVLAVIESSVFMAGAVHQLHALLREVGVRRLVALGVVLLFAVHPAVVYYGANGLSEALFVFFLIVATRQLVTWTRTSETMRLVTAGLMLAFGYLTRYEAVVALTGAVVAVAAFTYLRTAGPRRSDRVAPAVVDVVVLAAPVVFVGGVWSFASWLIVGTPFAQETSVYGNASIIAHVSAARHSLSSSLGFSVGEVDTFVPLFFLLLVVALVAALVRWRRDVVVPLAVMGSVLLFEAAANARGLIGGTLRYYIVAVPLTYVLVGVALADKAGAGHVPAPRLRLANLRLPNLARAGLPRPSLQVAGVAALVALAVQLPFSHAGMTSDRRTGVLRSYAGERAAARYLDAKRLGTGSVLVDAATGFPVVLASTRPRQFVITSDRDFESILVDPQAANVRYVLVPAPVGYYTIDAVNRVYPRMYGDGGGIARLVRQFQSPEAPPWRLYELKRSG